MSQPPGPNGPPEPPPPSSRLRPPWHDAPSEERTATMVWTLVGFLTPWLLITLAALFSMGWFPIGVAGVGILLIAVFIGAIIALAVAKSTAVRGTGYGALTGCLIQLILGAIGFVIFFGWCLSQLNDI